MIFEAARRGPVRAFLVEARGGLDSYGDPVDDWADPVLTPIKGAVVQSVSSVETFADGTARTVTTRVLRVPGDPGIAENDRVDVDGERFTVEGLTAVHRGLTARPVYTTVALRQVAATTREAP